MDEYFLCFMTFLLHFKGTYSRGMWVHGWDIHSINKIESFNVSTISCQYLQHYQNMTSFTVCSWVMYRIRTQIQKPDRKWGSASTKRNSFMGQLHCFIASLSNFVLPYGHYSVWILSGIRRTLWDNDNISTYWPCVMAISVLYVFSRILVWICRDHVVSQMFRLYKSLQNCAGIISRRHLGLKSRF
jgi:hypothetical protein